MIDKAITCGFIWFYKNRKRVYNTNRLRTILNNHNRKAFNHYALSDYGLNRADKIKLLKSIWVRSNSLNYRNELTKYENFILEWEHFLSVFWYKPWILGSKDQIFGVIIVCVWMMNFYEFFLLQIHTPNSSFI